MATFGDIQTKVSKRLLDPSNTAVSLSDVAASINDSISYWKFRRFWFNEVYDSGTMTEEDGTIPLPSDFLVPATQNDGFNIEYGSMRYPLKKISQPQYDGIWLNNGYGLPRMYARLGQSYEVYPLPDRAYTINRHYLKDYPALTASGQSNDFTDYADRLLVLWSCANLIAEIREDDKMEAYFRTAAENEYNNLQVMTGKSNATGSLSLNSTFLD